MVSATSILRIFLLLFLLSFSLADLHAAPLKFRAKLTGTHDIDWTFQLKENTLPGGGNLTETTQEGTEFVDYTPGKPAIIIFKKKPGLGLVGTVKGTGIDKFPEVKANITNGNVVGYSCSGVCPPPPDITPLSSGCGNSSDTGNVKLEYSSGVFTIDSLHASDLFGLPGGAGVPPLPPGVVNPADVLLPVGPLSPLNCGPIFPPNNPAQDLIDFRYPFLVISDSAQDFLPGKPATAIDNKLKNVKIGKTITVKLNTVLSPSKTELHDGSGYIYSGELGVHLTLKLKRLS